jgi:predicted nucleotidyltransferase
MKEAAVEYLMNTYHPRALLVYGSYVHGDQDEYSDFDCMVIVDEKTKNHDDAVIEGVQLDCFIYTADEILTEDPDTFLPVYDAEILKDDGIGEQLQKRVRQYIQEHEKIDDSEKAFIASWIRKMMKRVQKNDDEGNFRAVAFLWESLTDYCLLRDLFYFGSKKTIQYLRKNDRDGYELFHQAITLKTNESILNWANYVIHE